MDDLLSDSPVSRLRQIGQRVCARITTQDIDFIKNLICFCAAAEIDPDDICDEIYSEMFHRAYSATNNPFFVWHAYASFQSDNRPIPLWIYSYINRTAVNLLKLAQSGEINFNALKSALGIKDMRQASSYANAANHCCAVSELFTEKSTSKYGEIQHVYTAVSQKYNVSPECLKKWQETWASVVNIGQWNIVDN